MLPYEVSYMLYVLYVYALAAWVGAHKVVHLCSVGMKPN